MESREWHELENRRPLFLHSLVNSSATASWARQWSAGEARQSRLFSISFETTDALSVSFASKHRDAVIRGTRWLKIVEAQPAVLGFVDRFKEIN